MKRRWISAGAVAILAGMGWLLLIPGNADAQRLLRRGGGMYGGYGGYGMYGPYSNWTYPNGTYPSNMTPYGNTPYQYQGNTIVPQAYQSFYPPAQNYGGAAPTGNRANIDVRVPNADAQVWFEGQQTQQKGMERTFTSPPLEAGYRYSYNVRARWRQDGRAMDETRTVQIQPGRTATVNFTSQQSGAQQPD